MTKTKVPEDSGRRIQYGLQKECRKVTNACSIVRQLMTGKFVFLSLGITVHPSPPLPTSGHAVVLFSGIFRKERFPNDGMSSRILCFQNEREDSETTNFRLV